MDFFKSVFSADPDDDDAGPSPADPSPAASASGGGATAWNLGGLMKTIATRSESVIQTYKKDLSEFGSELKKETAAIRSVAARAVLDLPGSLEAGASAAHDSLESVGQAIDDLGGTVRALLLSPDPPDTEPDSPAPSKRYSRFDAQLLSLQSDPSTFDDVTNMDDYSAWKSGFDLSIMEEEIEILCYENPNLEAIFQNMVPGAVDYDTFWNRYYYRVYKLKQAEDVRANLVKRAIAREEEDEELTWEVDDEEEDAAVKKEVIVTDEVPQEEEEVKEIAGSSEVKTVHEAGVKIDEVVTVIPEEAAPVVVTGDEESAVMPVVGDEESAVMPVANDGALSSKAEVKVDPAESSKDSDFSVVSSQPSMPEEDDLGWDEIEDLGDNDDKKVVSSGGSPSRVDLRKRLSAAEDDEDLSWDIEEDEDPAKP